VYVVLRMYNFESRTEDCGREAEQNLTSFRPQQDCF
jgi:hypothetical protein